MNIKPLIDAVESMDEALAATFQKSERNKIKLARSAIAKVLQSHGVFLQKEIKK